MCQSLPAFHLDSNFHPLPHLKHYFRYSLEEGTTISPVLFIQFVLSVKDWRGGAGRWEQTLN